jgi:hypothetical protein
VPDETKNEESLPLNSLLRFPDVAQQVGYLIMYSANLEIWLLEIFKKFLRHDDGIAEVTFGNIDNLSARLDIIYKICEIKSGHFMSRDILETRKDTLEAVAFRNACAHGNFGLSKEGKPNLTSNILSFKRGKPKTITLYVDQMRNHVNALRKTLMLMRKHVGADLLIAHHGTVDGVHQASPEKPFQAKPKNKLPPTGRPAQRRRIPPESSQETEQ